jgi:hypothetical protein
MYKRIITFQKKLFLLCEDNIFRGALCGLVAGFIKDSVDAILYILDIKSILSFWGFASVVVFNELPKDWFMNIVALTLELIFSAFIAILFVFCIQKIKTRHYLLLGAFYSSMVWFFIKGIILAFTIELLTPKTNLDPLIAWLLSMAFGIIIAFLNHKLAPQTS